MSSLNDCIAVCGLNDAAARESEEHEHLPQIAAVALGQCLLHRDDGPERFWNMIVDDVRCQRRLS